MKNKENLQFALDMIGALIRIQSILPAQKDDIQSLIGQLEQGRFTDENVDKALDYLEQAEKTASSRLASTEEVLTTQQKEVEELMHTLAEITDKHQAEMANDAQKFIESDSE